MKKFFCILFVLMILVFSSSVQPVLAVEPTLSYTPNSLTATLMEVDELHPYGSALLTFKINNLPSSTDVIHWEVNIEKKIGDADWSGTNGVPSETFLEEYQTSTGVFQFEQLWVETLEWDGSKPISYRVFVKQYDYTWTGVDQSNYSNIASIGLLSSKWAVPELNTAISLDLIPDILNGKDLAKPITREEFAELAVLLYDKAGGSSIEPVSSNPFSDTTNPQILKAFKLGITKGVSATAFEPQTLINREQCAAMLYRTMQAIKPDGDFTVTGFKNFPDQKDIDGWALEAVKYMSSNGIIKGDSKGYFMPRAVTAAQKAAGYGNATREASIIMSMRSYEDMK